MSDFLIPGQALTREQYLARQGNRQAGQVFRHKPAAYHVPPELPPSPKYRPSGAEQRKARKERGES